MTKATRNTFCGTWYQLRSNVHNNQTVPIKMLAIRPSTAAMKMGWTDKPSAICTHACTVVCRGSALFHARSSIFNHIDVWLPVLL